MPEQIKFSEFFDFGDSGELDKFIAGINSIKKEYGDFIKGLDKSSKAFKKANDELIKAILAQEAALKNANSTTKEGQTIIAKAAETTEKLTKATKQAADEEAKNQKAKAEAKKNVKELSEATKLLEQQTTKATKTNVINAGSIQDLKKRVSDAKLAFEAMGDEVDPIAKTKALANYAKLKQELDQVNAATTNAAKGNDLSKGSYNELDKEVKDLLKDLKNLPDVYGKNRDQAEKLKKTIHEKTQTLKDFDKETNVTNRNVGNYTDSLKEAALHSGLFGGRVGELAEKLSKTQGSLKKVTGGLGGVRAAIAATGIGALLIALGALVAVFTKTDAGGERLERMFAGVGAVVEFITGLIAKLGGYIIDAFDNIGKLGGYIKDAFNNIGPALSNPTKLIKDFGAVIQDQVITRFKAFGLAVEAIKTGNFKKLADATIQLATAVTDGTDKLIKMGQALGKTVNEATRLFDAAVEIKRGFQELEDAERVYGITALKSRGIVETLIATAKDRTIAEKERLANLDKAGAIEKENTDQELKLAQQRFDLIVKENQLKTKLNRDEVIQFTQSLDAYEKYASRRGTLTDDDLDKQKEAQAKLIQLQQDSELKQQQIQNRRSKFLEEEEALRKKALDERLAREKKLQDDLDALRKYVLDQDAKEQMEIAENEKNSAETRNNAYRKAADDRIKIAEIERDAALRDDKITENGRLLALAEFAGKVKEIEKGIKVIKLNITFDGQKALDSLDTLFKKQLLYLKKSKADGLITEEQYSKDEQRIQEDRLKKRIDTLKLAQASEKDILDAELDYASFIEQKKTDAKQKQEEIKGQILDTATNLGIEIANRPFEQATAQRAQELTDLQAQKDYELSLVGDNKAAQAKINKEFALKEKKIKKEQAEADRNQALYNIAINTAVGIAKDLTAGLPEAIPLIAATVILGALQAATVLSRPLPKFAKGTESAPEGLALVDEQGPEIIERNGKRYLGQSKGARLAYLRRGDKVRTAEETKRIIDGRMPMNVLDSYNESISKLSGIHIGSEIDYDKLASKLAPHFDKMESAIKNKKELHLTYGKKGMEAYLKEGNVATHYLNNKITFDV